MVSLTKRKETVDLIEDLIQEFSGYLEVENKDLTNYIDNGDGTYTLPLCNTYWFRVGDKFKDSSTLLDIEIIEVKRNDSITVKASISPTQANKATLTKPLYYHGTIISANNELDKLTNIDGTDKPIIYLLEPYNDTNYRNGSALDRESTLTLFFLCSSDFSSWETNDHYQDAIQPMREMLNVFINKIVERSTIIEQELIDTYDTTNRVRFGVFTNNKGQTTNLMNQHLSGVELRITIPFTRASCSDC